MQQAVVVKPPPVKGPAFRIDRLPEPSREHDLVYVLRDKTGKKVFETEDKMIGEDRGRAVQLRAWTPPASLRASPDDALFRWRARKLAERLEQAADNYEPLASLASAYAVRELRRRLSSFWMAAAEEERSDAGVEQAFVTLVSHRYIVGAEDLRYVDPRELNEALRSCIKRKLPKGKKRGFAALYLHGDHDPRTNVFRLHHHGIATGDYLDAIRALQKQARDRRVRNRTYAKGTAVRLPIKIQLLRDDAPQISYAVQGFWPSRFQRGRIRGRAGNLYMLWIDRWRLADVELVIGSMANRHRP